MLTESNHARIMSVHVAIW